MKGRLALIVCQFVCAAFLLSACSSASAVGQGGGPVVSGSQSPAATAQLRTRDGQATPAPAVGARNVKPTKEGETAQPASAAGAQGAAPSGTGRFLATELLGRPTDHSVAVNVVPAEDLEIYFEYGVAPGPYTGQTHAEVCPAGKPFEVTIDGLQPNTRTYYRMRYRRPGAADFAAGEEHSFWTQRAPGSTFTFGVQADSHLGTAKHNNPDLYTRTLLNAQADQPDFYIDLGDTFRADHLKIVAPDTVAQLYLDQRPYFGLVADSAPLFLVNGNHEMEWGWGLDGTPNNPAVWAGQARNLYYPQPAPDGFYTGDAQPVEFIGHPRDYYAWTWGDALFVVIDPYWHTMTDPGERESDDESSTRTGKDGDLWNITLGEAQYRWFAQTLAQSDARYKFVFAHHVLGTGRGGVELADLYEWGGKNKAGAWEFDQRRPGWELPIHQLMVKNGVTIFFQGHDHVFARQERDGVNYQAVPMPADPTYSAYNADSYRSGDIRSNSGYIRLTVSPDHVVVDYIRAFLPAGETGGHVNGEVAFCYTVAGGSQPPAAVSTRVLLPVVTASPMPTTTPSPAVALAGNIVLGRPTDRSVTASLLSDVDLVGHLEYGTPSAVTVDYVRSYLPKDENAQRKNGDVSYTYTIRAP